MPMPPLPRHLEPAGPDPELFAVGLLFLWPVSPVAVPREIDGPAASHHSRVDLATFGAADGDHAAVLVMISRRAFDATISGEFAEHRRCVPAALINVAVPALAGLLALGRINAPKPDVHVSDNDGVAIDDAGGPERSAAMAELLSHAKPRRAAATIFARPWRLLRSR